MSKRIHPRQKLPCGVELLVMREAQRVRMTTKIGRRYKGYEIPIGIINQEAGTGSKMDTLTIKLDPDYLQTPVWFVTYDNQHGFSDTVMVHHDSELGEADWIKNSSEAFLKKSINKDWWGDVKIRELFRKAVSTYVTNLDNNGGDVCTN